MKRPFCVVFAMAVVGCDAQIPEIDPTLLACEDDVPFGEGLLPCPAQQACFEQRCTRRWQCDDRQDGNPGCTPDTTRCEPAFGEWTSRVQCVSGVHTSSTTIPDPGDSACDCPDGLFCVAYAGAETSEGLPLYLLPEGGDLPSDMLGTASEQRVFRRCVRACSSEVNCPPDHTCRPAAAVTEAFSSERDRLRNTVGVCYPNTLVDTSTTVRPPQPDVRTCRQNADCVSFGPGQGCRAENQTVADHPDYPAGDAAREGLENVAIVTRCDAIPAGAGTPNSGCTSSPACGSGVCLGGRCRTLCDPQDPITACGSASCGPVLVTREIDRTTSVSDELFLCR